MRFRSSLSLLTVIGGAALMLSACSTRPENSPVVRKKFAEIEKNTQTVEEMSADITLLNDRIASLVQENEELRAFLPDIDGESAIDRIAKLEARIRQLETLTSDDVFTAAADQRRSSGSSSSSQETAQASSTDADDDIVNKPLANAPKEQSAAEVAMQQEATQQRPARNVSSFREKTNPKPAAKPAESKPVRRGSWHTISSGESISEIAKKYDLTSAEIRKANNIPNGAKVPVGQRLFIPGSN